MADPNLAQCFWTYPESTASVPPGQPLSFQVIVPLPSVPAFPLTGLVVNWSLTDDSTGQLLVAGDDYQLLSGDLQSNLLSLVFKPVAGRTISVAPTLSLFYAGATGIINAVSNPTQYPQFAPQTYSLAGLTTNEQKSVVDMIINAISLSAKKSIIEPGEAALLKVLPRSMADVPQVVTSVLHEAPSVEIRGAIPLDSLVEAIMGPITGALGSALPGSKASLEEAGDEVRRLLGEPLAIPLAIDVMGKRISTTLAPVGVPEVPVFTSSPQETNSFRGMVPIGKWQSPFIISSATWAVQEAGQCTVNQDLSPGLDFIKSFLLKPKIVPLSASAGLLGAPTPITVTVTIHIELDPTVFSVPGDVQLPSVTLFHLPLCLPRVAAAFADPFDEVHSSTNQEAFIATDVTTLPLIPSLDDFLRLLTRLTTALNNVMAVATALGAEWQDIFGIASTLSVLSDKLGRIKPGRIYFFPIWTDGGSVTVQGDVISAVIYVGISEYIGPPGHVGIPLTATYFRLSDSNGRQYIDFGKPLMSSYSILPNLKGKFSMIQQIPPNSAAASNPGYHYDNRMEVLGFPKLRVFPTPAVIGTLATDSGKGTKSKALRKHARGR
jgi:hypothetical protein